MTLPRILLGASSLISSPVRSPEPPLVLNPPQRNKASSVVQAPPVLPYPRAPRSILEREASLSSPTRLTVAQSATDAAVSGGLSSLQSPATFAFLLGGGLLARSALWGYRSAEINAVSSAVVASPRLKWGAATVSLVLAGCGADFGADFRFGQRDGGTDGGMIDAAPDGGPIIDRDADGYPQQIDCNDGNKNIHPLNDGETIVIDSSRTICPGIYHGVHIFFKPGKTGIQLVGTGVTLDGEGSTEQAIRIDQANQAVVRDFTVQDYRTDAGSISVLNTDQFTLQGVTVETGGFWAIKIKTSPRATFQDIDVTVRGDRGVEIDHSDGFTMRNSDLRAEPPYEILPWYGLLQLVGGSGHVVQNNTIVGGQNDGIRLFSIGGATLQGNIIQSQLATGIFLENSDGNTFRNNTITGNGGFGVKLTTGSTGNAFHNNDLRSNLLGAVFIDNLSSDNTFTGNQGYP